MLELLELSPYTPEMNPIEQIWKEIRKLGFRNEIFESFDQVIECLCQVISSLTHHTIKSITGRSWIMELS